MEQLFEVGFTTRLDPMLRVDTRVETVVIFTSIYMLPGDFLNMYIGFNPVCHTGLMFAGRL